MAGEAMLCCAYCFGDAFLAKQIESYNGGTGDCSYCKSSSALVTEPIRLRDHFELLLGVYSEDSGGQTLTALFKADWNLCLSLSDAACGDLLSEILGDSEAVTRRFTPTIADDGSSLERWQRFRDELRHENRFFPKNIPDLDRLGELLKGVLVADAADVPSVLYRARINSSDTPYPPDRMRKPPREMSSHGRANPAGIPYLYLASDIDTAISELRPHTGERVCVAEFRLLSKPGIADLRDPRTTISPFTLGDEHDIAQLRNDIGLLCQLGEELTHPVSPEAAHIEYLPSQYLCEFIKHLGLDGVMYRSAVGAGTNFAIFEDDCVEVTIVHTYTVKQVRVEAEITPA